jgi:hypothetical protein
MVSLQVTVEALAASLHWVPVGHEVIVSAADADAEGKAPVGDPVDARYLLGQQDGGHTVASMTELSRPTVDVAPAASASATVSETPG